MCKDNSCRAHQSFLALQEAHTIGKGEHTALQVFAGVCSLPAVFSLKLDWQQGLSAFLRLTLQLGGGPSGTGCPERWWILHFHYTDVALPEQGLDQAPLSLCDLRASMNTVEMPL